MYMECDKQTKFIILYDKMQLKLNLNLVVLIVIVLN